MFGSRKKRKPSLIRKLVYLLVFLSGGGAGIGGTFFKDHPAVQAVLSLFSGAAPPQTVQALDSTIASEIENVVASNGSFSEPGTYEVVISNVELDPSLFKAGHTLDIQARVVKLDPGGHDETVFETREYGERLATAGRDQLAAGWPHRPFHVSWRPGESLIVEVFDRKTGLFAEPMRFVLAPSDPEPREFPLRSGAFTLEPERKQEGAVDPLKSRIVLESQRLSDESKGDQTGTNRMAHDDSLIIK